MVLQNALNASAADMVTEYDDKTEANSPLLLTQHAPNSRTRKPRSSCWGSCHSRLLFNTLAQFKPQGVPSSEKQS